MNSGIFLDGVGINFEDGVVEKKDKKGRVNNVQALVCLY